MKRIIYSSHCHEDFKVFDILSMLKKAQANNDQLGLSGLLLFGNGRFLQVLEGNQGPIDGLFNIIRNDARHNNIVIHEETDVEELQFTLWKMSYISMDKMGLGRGVDKNLKKFEPENNSLEENFKLLKSVENYLSQIQDNLHSDPLKAWVVDDDPLILKAMSLCTKKTPIDVRTFESPIDLLDAFKKEQKPDILLSDFHMPCFDGLKLLKEVRKLDFEMPMLMLSADSDNESVAKAISLGADGYLFKPFRKDDLMVGIRQAILSAQITSGLSL